MPEVVIWDTIGGKKPYNSSKPLGGSEMAVLSLQRGLTHAGVMCVIRDVEADIEVDALVIQRYSEPPKKIRAKKTVVWVHDKEPQLYRHRHLEHIFVGAWQRQRFGGEGRVIHPIISDDVYALQELDLPKKPGRWIYPCAKVKGLEATRAAWKALNHFTENRELVEVIAGTVPPYTLAREIATSEGMFYVNTYEECFPATVQIAAMMGCKLAIRCWGHERCGIQEAMVVRDLREQTIIPKWLEALGL